MQIKKIILLFFILFEFSQISYAEYKPIPENLKMQYKSEIEQIIIKETRCAANKARLIYIKSSILYIKFLLNKNNKNLVEKYIYDMEGYERIMDTPFSVLQKLIDNTNNYVDIVDNEPATDNSNALYDYMQQYFIDNDINTKKIDNLYAYINARKKQIEKYYEKMCMYSSYNK